MSTPAPPQRFLRRARPSVALLPEPVGPHDDARGRAAGRRIVERDRQIELGEARRATRQQTDRGGELAGGAEDVHAHAADAGNIEREIDGTSVGELRAGMVVEDAGEQPFDIGARVVHRAELTVDAQRRKLAGIQVHVAGAHRRGGLQQLDHACEGLAARRLNRRRWLDLRRRCNGRGRRCSRLDLPATLEHRIDRQRVAVAPSLERHRKGLPSRPVRDLDGAAVAQLLLAPFVEQLTQEMPQRGVVGRGDRQPQGRTMIRHFGRRIGAQAKLVAAVLHQHPQEPVHTCHDATTLLRPFHSGIRWMR